MISRSTELPPGTILIFEGVEDEYGNWDYTGDYILIGETGEPVTIDPTYSTRPNLVVTEPQGQSEPTPGNIFVAVKEGIRFFDAPPQSVEITPDVVTGWLGSESIKVLDGVFATTNAPDSVYCDTLELTGFNVEGIPTGAIITGIKVTVERDKL
jgi:hypothetical protein